MTCACGCGQMTAIAKTSNRRKGHRRGEPFRFIKYHNLPANHARAMVPIEKRLWSNTILSDGGCWEFGGARDIHGYGRIGDRSQGKNTMELAHRVAWRLIFGPVPRGLGVLHHCDNPPCVNPVHLFLGTQRDNMQDAKAKGRLHTKHGRDGKWAR